MPGRQGIPSSVIPVHLDSSGTTHQALSGAAVVNDPSGRS